MKRGSFRAAESGLPFFPVRRAEDHGGRLGDHHFPVFLWADEAQHFVTAHDMLFQQTARSARAATVYLTQNISNYYATMGGRAPQAAAESLLGNLNTKIFHANGDAATNQWGERIFGYRKGELASRTTFPKPSKTEQESMLPVVPSAEFTTLAKGGADGGSEVIIFMTGRRSTRSLPPNSLSSQTHRGEGDVKPSDPYAFLSPKSGRTSTTGSPTIAASEMSESVSVLRAVF